MTVETWPIDRPIPYARNPRVNSGAVDKVAASLREFGWKQPVVVDAQGVIVVGHTRVLAAKKLGMAEVPVVVAHDLTPAQSKAYRLADNRTNEEAEWDRPLLALEIEDLKLDDFDLTLTGFDEDELAGLEAEASSTREGLTDPDDAPEPPARPVSVLGDLWILGNHRVLCGDATSMSDVQRLMAGEKADMVFTDPPYGINIVKTKKNSGNGVVGGGGIVKPKLYAPIINDGGTETAAEFYKTALSIGIEKFVIFGGNYFTDFLPPSPCWAIWDKQNSGNFADVEMAWTSFDKGAKLYRFLWNGLSRQGDRKTELATRAHPTQKPVGLIQDIFQDFPCEICFDGFLGSGSTLIACEKTGRRCYGMELSPAYADVIVRRWQNFTGKQAVREDGTPFEERAA